jgi:hypothetical protein
MLIKSMIVYSTVYECTWRMKETNLLTKNKFCTLFHGQTKIQCCITDYKHPGLLKTHLGLLHLGLHTSLPYVHTDRAWLLVCVR